MDGPTDGQTIRRLELLWAAKKLKIDACSQDELGHPPGGRDGGEQKGPGAPGQADCPQHVQVLGQGHIVLLYWAT